MTLPHDFDTEALLKNYAPVLVLFPEISPGSTRQTNPAYPHVSPLDQDYHPRDIRMVLEHSSLDRRFRFGSEQPHSWQETLDAMESRDYETDLDLLTGVPPADREAFWKVYAEIDKDRREYRRACYARVVTGQGLSEDRLLAQYWYPYFYNDFWNTHEMDWEAINLVFKLVNDRPAPTLCAISAHECGGWLPWSQVEKAEAGDGGDPVRSAAGDHPVVYVASGSHAGYFHGPSLYVTASPLVSMASDLLKKNRRLVDYTSSWEEGSPQLIEPRIIPPSPNGLWSGNWRWLNQKGTWGSRGKFLDLEFGDSGPVGPPQKNDPWNHPFRWIDTSFTRAPSKAEAIMPTLVEPGAE